MSENETMRKYAEAHGFNIGNDQYTAPRPLPCMRDEHGEIHDQKVKWLIAKIDEELNEIKELIYHEVGGYDVLYFLRDDEIKELIAEEAADTITAITTFCYYCGIDAEMRDDAQRRVNERNRERGRL